jgi:hypothetical protein
VKAAWAPFAVVCAVALGRALIASVPAYPDTAGDAQRHEVFRHVASDEVPERREAAKTFPTDLWSRDDDFHQKEGNRARDWAKSHHIRFGDALSALDEGLRAHWPHGNATPLVATVPPCRPRAIY